MKSSKDIEADIQDLEAQLEPLTFQLDAKIEEFAVALAPVVERWMGSETKRRIEENADVVNAAGIDSLRNLKAELAGLYAHLPELCIKAIGGKSDWPHRRPAATPEGRRSNSGESYFANIFRVAISHLGAVLNSYGLLRDPAGYVRSWEQVSANQFRYAINPGFEERSFTSVVEYKGLHTVYKKKIEELEEMRRELAKAKARELWDDA